MSRLVSFSWFAAGGASAVVLGAAGCKSSHNCPDLGLMCGTTTLALQAPGNAWAPGDYALNLEFGGETTTCTLSVPSSAQPGASFSAACSDPRVQWSLGAICPPMTWCDDAAHCSGGVSRSDCLPGQYDATLLLTPYVPGSDGSAALFSSVTVDIALGGHVLVHATVRTTSSTRQPSDDEYACGYRACTNAAGTVRVAATDAGATIPCDPLAPEALTLGTVLGAGADPQNTLYVADQVPDGGQQRVFVSDGGALVRQHVNGSGSGGGPTPADVDYAFTYQSAVGDASDAKTLFIQVRGGATTAVALGPGNAGKAFYSLDAGDQLLTIVDARALGGLSLANLPVQIEYVADLSDGNVLVVTMPMDPWGYGGARLYYGPASGLVERPIPNYVRTDSEDQVSFAGGAGTYTAHLTFPPFVGISDGGPPPHGGPASLDTPDAGSLSMTERQPPPTSLSSLPFTCLAH